MIKVLHIVPALDGGGIENLLFNYYSHMNRENIEFDFIVHGDNEGVLESKFRSMNSKIFHIATKQKSFFANLTSMKQIISYGNYNVVHVHQDTIAVFPMYYARKAGVEIRITHSHWAYKNQGFHKKVLDLLLRPFLKHNSTHWFACGLDAGKSLWGGGAVNQGKVIVMNNAINIDEYTFNADVRNKKREELNVKGKFVVANVGRFSEQKNHEFIILTFHEVYKRNSNAVLLLIGRGELEGDIKKQVSDLGMSDVVQFLGIRDDVAQLLQAIDVFVLPSKYEGLPVVIVEAQAAGVRSIVSDVVTAEVGITDLVNFESLEKSYVYWANKILMFDDLGYKRLPKYSELKLGGYDIRQEARKLELFYGGD